MFEALLHRGERRRAERRYREGLAWLQPASSAAEAASAREAAAERAGPHLTERARAEVDEEVDVRVSVEAAKLYGDELAKLSLGAVIDGTWRRHVADIADQWSQWLRPEHRADQHWQVAEAIVRTALAEGRVDDDALAALDRFLAEVDPDGPRTLDDRWYGRFVTARLDVGLLPRPRAEPRLITQEGETIIFTEPGTVLDVVEELDASDRLRLRTVILDVRIDASDLRLAVFGEQLLFATPWHAVVGVTTGDDDHGPYIQVDDAAARATHVVHAESAELLAAIAREMHRRSGA